MVVYVVANSEALSQMWLSQPFVMDRITAQFVRLVADVGVFFVLSIFTGGTS